MSIEMGSGRTTYIQEKPHTPAAFQKGSRGIWRWVIAVFVASILFVGFAMSFIDEPLRTYAERQLNSHLAGYTFRIGTLDFHPIGLSLDLENVIVLQDARQDPPLAHIEEWHASIHWEALLSGHLVSDHIIDRPVIHFTRPQAAQEIQDAPAQRRAGRRPCSTSTRCKSTNSVSKTAM